MKNGSEIGNEMAAVVLKFICAILLVILVLSVCACAGMPVPVCPEVTIKFCPVNP